MLPIFDMHNPNKQLFLKTSFLFLLLAFLVPVALIVPLTTIHLSLKSRISDLNIEVLNFMFLLTEYWLLHKSFTWIRFLSQMIRQLNSLIA